MPSALDQFNALTDQATQAYQNPTPPLNRPFQQPAGTPSARATPAVPPPPPPPPSLLDRAASFIRDNTSTTSAVQAAEGIGAGILRAPGQLIGGLADTASDAGKFIDHNIQSPFVRQVVKGGLGQATGVGATGISQAQSDVKQYGGKGASLADVLSDREGLGQVGNKGINDFTTQALPIAASLPFGGEATAAPEAAPLITKVLAQAGHVLMNSAKVGAATAIVADPRAQRISTMIQQAGVHTAIIDYLAGNPNDEDLEGRLKNGIEGALGNAAAEPIFTGLGKLIKSAMGGDQAAVEAGLKDLPKAQPNAIQPATPAEAASDGLDRSFATGRTQEARYTQQEANNAAQQLQNPQGQETPPKPPGGAAQETAPSQEALDAGTRHSDVAGGDTNSSTSTAPNARGATPTPEHPLTGLATDANAAIAKSGGAEVLHPDTMQLTPEGKIVVAQGTKDALDRNYLGRSFDTAEGLNGPPQEIFKETSPDGGSRVVGMMGKDDLDGFVNDVRKNLIGPDDGSMERIDSETAPDLASRVGQWSIGKLGAPYDVPAFMRAIADRVGGSPRPLSDLELNNMAKIIADQTGLHQEDILSLGQQVAGSTQDLPIGLQAVRTVQTRLLKDLFDVNDDGLLGLPEDHPAVQDAMQRVHNAITFASYLEESKTAVGQALRVQGIPDADTYLESAAQRAKMQLGPDGKPPLTPQPPLAPTTPGQLPLPRTTQELADWLAQFKAMSTTGDPAGLQAFMKGKLTIPNKWAYLGTSLANFFTGAIVSAPRTLVRDLWGPAIISGLQTIERTAGNTGLALAFSAMGRTAEAKEAWMAAQSAPRAYVTVLSDTADALRTAAKTTAGGFQRGSSAADPFWDPFGANLGSMHPSLGGESPFDLKAGVPKVLIDAAMQRGGAGVSNAVPYWAGNLINKFPTAVMALHAGFNEAAQQLAYKGEIRATAYQDIGKLGLQGQDAKDFLADRLYNSVDNSTGAATDPNALASAQRSTLVKQPTEDDPVAMRLAFQTKQNIVKAVPAMRFIIPIFTVPANALGESLRRIPGIGFLMKESGEALTGQRGVQAMGDAYGRMMLGAGVLSAGAVLGQTGHLTGGGPTDAADREAWEGRAGDGSVMHQPYSIRMGDKWYSYQKADVVGPILSIAAAFNDKTMYTPGSEDLTAHAQAAIWGITEYMKDQAALQGIAQVMNFGGNPQESDHIFTRVMGQVASGFVPGFVKQLRDQMDPTQREHHTVGDYIMDSIPGVSQTLDPVRNVLGEPVMKPQSPVFGTLPVSMSNINSYAQDPVQDENSRLYEVTGEAHGVLPPGLGPNSGQVDMRDVKLEDGRSLYDHLMSARMSSTNDDGQTLKQALTQLYSSDDYRSALDGKSTDRVDPNGNPLKGAMVRDTFNEFARKAREDVANDSPIAARYMAVAHAMNADPIATHGYNAHQLAGSPPLLSSLGININDYESLAKGQ